MLDIEWQKKYSYEIEIPKYLILIKLLFIILSMKIYQHEWNEKHNLGFFATMHIFFCNINSIYVCIPNNGSRTTIKVLSCQRKLT